MKAQNLTAKTLDVKRLAKALEPTIRKVVREELARIATSKPGVFYLDATSPLYQDMEQILRESKSGSIKLLSREEALSD